MNELYEIIRWAGIVLWVVLALIAVRQWMARRTSATAWLATTFGILAYLAVSQLLPEGSDETVPRLLERIQMAILALFPYALWRFHLAFVRPVRWFWVFAHVMTGLVIVSSLLIDIPEDDAARPPLVQALILILLLQWVVLSVRVAWRLWTRASDQPTVSRRRMRTMSMGSIALVLALLLAFATSDEGVTWAGIVVQLFAFAAGPLFLFGFAPPGIVRNAWRRPEEDALRDAQLRLWSRAYGADPARGVERAVVQRRARDRVLERRVPAGGLRARLPRP